MVLTVDFGLSRSFGPSRNDGLSSFNRSQEFLSHLACRETTNFTIVRIVIGRSWRTDGNELFAILLDKLGKILTVEGRHMPHAAMRTVIIAHAGPLIGPYPPAAGTSVEIEKPGRVS
jgi:hypothetical protein